MNQISSVEIAAGQGAAARPAMARDQAPSGAQAAVTQGAAPVEPQAAQAAAPPEPPPASKRKMATYIGAGMLIGLSQSLTMGFASANIPQLAGDLHATTLQATWVMAGIYAPRAVMPLMLIKIRNQFGLRPFAELGILAFAASALLYVMVDDLHSAVVVAVISGIAAAPLSSLAFLYILETLPAQFRMSVGLSGALTMIMIGRPLARALLPSLTAYQGWQAVALFQLGLSLMALAAVYLLPLAHKPREKTLSLLDFVSFTLLALGFGGLTLAFLFGAYDYWTQTRWIGLVLAGSIVALAVAVMIELNRAAPLVDIGWVLSPKILHLAATLFVFRLTLSEQSAGAVGLLRTLGMQADQQQVLFTVVTLATLAAGLVCARWNSPARVAMFHVIALAMIAAGAWMDSHATALTRPEQMYLSQAMIGFASLLFLPPAMAQGLIAAFAKGPNYLLSFIMVFLATQSLGGIVGSGLLRSLVIERTAFHQAQLMTQVSPGNPQLAGTLHGIAAQYAAQLTDGAQRSAAAMRQVATTVSQQAAVLAYDDVFRLIYWLALAALAALILHLGFARLWAWASPPADPSSSTA